MYGLLIERRQLVLAQPPVNAAGFEKLLNRHGRLPIYEQHALKSNRSSQHEAYEPEAVADP